MSSFKQIFYHIIISTKDRKQTIPESHCQHLYKYIWGIIKGRNCVLYQINGMPEHLHILCDLHPSLALADLIKDFKQGSSVWMKSNENFPKWDAWGKGYGAFTCSIKDKNSIIAYIKNQKEHHKKESFYDEYKRILIENEIQFDEKYMLG